MTDENQYKGSYQSVKDTYLDENLKESLLIKQRVEERSLSQPIQSTCLEQQQEESKAKTPTQIPGNIQQVSVDQQIFTYVRSDNFQGVSSLLGTLQSITAPPPEQQIPSLINIFDANQNTLLHLAAFHSNNDIFQLLVEYQMRKSFSYKSQDLVLEWVNRTNNQHQTALHLACFRGNYEMVLKIIELGGDYMKKNAQGLTPLHVICQCDQLKLLVYFKEKLNIDINIQDNSQGTPLHQGSYAGHDRIVHLLLAWGANIDAIDQEGFTPLHLAAVNGHFSIVRKLLVYGAKTTIKDKNNQTASEAAQENHQNKIASLIKKKRRFSLYKYFGIKMLPQKGQFKYSQSILFLFLYFLMLLYYLVFQAQYDFIKRSDNAKLQQKLLGYLELSLMGLSLILWFTVCCKDPGMLKKREKGKFIQILQRQDLNLDQLCFECENIIPKRSKHCDTCNRCVSVYDHHCPWINNCVGANNHGIFYLFLLILWISMADFIAMTVLSLARWDILQNCQNQYGIEKIKDLFKWWVLPEYQCIIQFSLGIFLSAILLFFFVLLTVLIFVQSKNLCSNRTTLERYAKPNGMNRTSSVEDINLSLEQRVSIEGRAQTAWYANCLLMCCINARSKPYHYVITEMKFQHEQRNSEDLRLSFE